MNKICLTQNNFDRLLELALHNCQNHHKNVHKPISFLNYNPDCKDLIESGHSYIDKNKVCKYCPLHYSKDDNDYDIIKQNCDKSLYSYKVDMDYSKKDVF